MKSGIHPDYVETTVHCGCGNTFTTRSTKKGGQIHVEDLLLAGVERMALRADLDVDMSALLRAARGERVAAAAVDRGLDVVRVNT